MTEGQHHLNCLTEAFSALLSSSTPESQVDAVRATVNEAKLSFDTLSNFLSKNLLALQERNAIELNSNGLIKVSVVPQEVSRFCKNPFVKSDDIQLN